MTSLLFPLHTLDSGGVAAHIYTQMVVVELGDNGSQNIAFPSEMGSKLLVDSVPKRGQVSKDV